ncbi:MAG: phasin family protein [Chromatocurvus sp.]
MTDEKSRMTDKAGEIAKNIWLAGVGAYGRAVDEAHGRLEKAGVESPKLFRDLVKAGAALEEEAQEALQAGQQARHSVEERINRVRDNFNLQRPVKGEDLIALHEKIDRLNNKVDALSAALAASGAVKTPRKKPAARKKKSTPAKPTARARAAGTGRSATAKTTGGPKRRS